MRDKIFHFLIIIMLFTFSNLLANTFEFESSRADAIGGTTLLSTPIPSEQLQNGSPLYNSKKFGFDFGYKRQYSLKELDLLHVAVSYRSKHYSFIAGFSQLGNADLYTKKNMRIGFLYTKSSITLGSYITGQFHDFNNRYNSVSAYAYSFSIRLQQKDFIMSSVIDNLNKPALSQNSVQTEPKLSIYAELHGSKIYKTTLKFSIQKNEDNKFGIGESVTISEIATIMFGFSTAPIAFGGGLDLKLKNNSFLYTSKYHPVLGLTHSVSFIINILHY